MEEAEYGGDSQPPSTRGRHIKKRALKNKGLSVSFSEKDLTDYVTGFHKRKKKRRKEANQALAEADRRKRIEARKKRKLERESVYGGAQPESSVVAEGSDEDLVDDDDDMVPLASVSGTTTYDNGDLKVMVTTREITREEEDDVSERPRSETAIFSGETEKQKIKIPVKVKVQSKNVVKRRPAKRQQKKRDKRKGKIQNTKR